LNSKISILLNVFNRPTETFQVLQGIRLYEPEKLYISIDGPRESKGIDEIGLINKVIAIIDHEVDWECEIFWKINESNKGCKRAIQGALKWFFENEEMGIILEDDTKPNKTFFQYCEVLLEQYKDNQKIFSINGCNLGRNIRTYNHGFTKYFNMWGWATWKRSWQSVENCWADYDSSNFKNSTENYRWLKISFLDTKRWLNHINNLFERTKNDQIDTWDYQWVYTAIINKQYSVKPDKNYIQNLGFNDKGTHTLDSNHPFSNLEFGSHSFEYQPHLKYNIDLIYELKYAITIWAGFSIRKIYWRMIKLFCFGKLLSKSMYFLFRSNYFKKL
jgi:hypothetical protein